MTSWLDERRERRRAPALSRGGWDLQRSRAQRGRSGAAAAALH